MPKCSRSWVWKVLSSRGPSNKLFSRMTLMAERGMAVKHVAVLRQLIDKQTGMPLGERWVREWMFSNRQNVNHLIPKNAPFTLIAGLKILFQYPYEAIALIVSKETGRTI